MSYLLYDTRFSLHRCFEKHPEQPDRTLMTFKEIKQVIPDVSSKIIPPRPALEEEILLCHSSEYVRLLKKEVQELGTAEHSVSFLSTGDVCISPRSFDIALLASGGVLTAIDHVLSTPSSPIFCLLRPPGHHATFNKGMGFCLFNNVAIGARYAQKNYGIERILIADWDVHHGNGTQDIFYEDPSIFYFSTHEQGLYPGTGHVEERGKGKGLGYTLNCPILPSIRARAEVLHAFEHILWKAMENFQPELVLISAGFDGHHDDPLGHFNLRTEDFYQLTRLVKKIAQCHSQGRIVSVLEGGYNLQALAESCIAHIHGLELNAS